MIDNLLRELGYVRTEHVNRALKQVRNAVGDEGFRQLQERFRPRYSVWAQYAMRWGFERFIAYPDNPVLVPGLEPWALASPTAWRDDKSVMLLYEVIGSSSTADGYVARREVRLAASIDGYHFDETAMGASF
jgi:hypothetical protein